MRVGSKRWWRAFAADERGSIGIEYALLGTLIALVMITGLVLLSGSLQELWDRVVRCLLRPAACDNP